MRWGIWLLVLPTLAAQDSWCYSTYLGAQGSEALTAIATDPKGNTYAAVNTSSLGPLFSDDAPGYRNVTDFYFS